MAYRFRVAAQHVLCRMPATARRLWPMLPCAMPWLRKTSAQAMWSPSEGEQLRALFRCAIANFPPQDQQHAIAFDLLCNLLNLLAATSTTPSTTPAKPSSQRTAVAIDDMDDDDLFFHILQQELTSVNRHFEESAGAILAQWAAHTRDASSRSTSTSSTPDRDRGLTASFDSSQSETWSATEDVCLHQQKARQVGACVMSPPYYSHKHTSVHQHRHGPSRRRPSGAGSLRVSTPSPLAASLKSAMTSVAMVPACSSSRRNSGAVASCSHHCCSSSKPSQPCSTPPATVRTHCMRIPLCL